MTQISFSISPNHVHIIYEYVIFPKKQIELISFEKSSAMINKEIVLISKIQIAYSFISVVRLGVKRKT